MLILRNMMISSGSGMRVLLHPALLGEMPVAMVLPRPLVQITLSTLAVFQNQSRDDHAIADPICDLGHLAEDLGFDFLSESGGTLGIG